MPIDNVIETVDVRTIYEAPISFHKEKLDDRVLSFLILKVKNHLILVNGKILLLEF